MNEEPGHLIGLASSFLEEYHFNKIDGFKNE